jgi:DNA-binding transcriptional regulator YiaG
VRPHHLAPGAAGLRWPQELDSDKGHSEPRRKPYYLQANGIPQFDPLQLARNEIGHWVTAPCPSTKEPKDAHVDTEPTQAEQQDARDEEVIRNGHRSTHESLQPHGRSQDLLAFGQNGQETMKEKKRTAVAAYLAVDRHLSDDLRGAKTLTQMAAELGTTKSTVRRWLRRDHWELWMEHWASVEEKWEDMKAERESMAVQRPPTRITD